MPISRYCHYRSIEKSSHCHTRSQIWKFRPNSDATINPLALASGKTGNVLHCKFICCHEFPSLLDVEKVASSSSYSKKSSVRAGIKTQIIIGIKCRGAVPTVLPSSSDLLESKKAFRIGEDRGSFRHSLASSHSADSPKNLCLRLRCWRIAPARRGGAAKI